MQSQMEAKLSGMNVKSPGLKSNMPSSPSARTFNISATDRQSLTFDSSSSFLSPDAANTVRNPSDGAALTFLASLAALFSAFPAPIAVPPSTDSPRHRRQLGKHDEYTAPAYVLEVGGGQQQRKRSWPES